MAAARHPHALHHRPEVVREVVYLPAYYPPDYAYYWPAYYLALPFGIVRQHRHVATSTSISTMMRRK